MKLKKKFLMLAIFSSLLILLPFQNCSKNPSVFEDSAVQETMDFFEYRYKAATEIYFEIQIVPDVEDPTGRIYRLLGLAAYSDGSSNNIEYEVEIIGTTCLRSGTLINQETLFEDSCLLPPTTVIGDVVIKVRRPGGEWHVYKKSYQN